jgi:hypothetical protein
LLDFLARRYGGGRATRYPRAHVDGEGFRKGTATVQRRHVWGSCSHAEANVSPSDGWRGNGGSHPSIDEMGRMGAGQVASSCKLGKRPVHTTPLAKQYSVRRRCRTASCNCKRALPSIYSRAQSLAEQQSQAFTLEATAFLGSREVSSTRGEDFPRVRGCLW